MNKKLLIPPIILMLLIVGFGGCFDINLDESIIKMSIVSFNVEPDVIDLGNTAKLNWAVIGADTVSINNDIGNVSLTGDTVIQPNETTTYVLTATNKTKSITANTKIIVNELTDEKENDSKEDDDKIDGNIPPEKPTITGFNSGIVYTEYSIEIVSNDADNDDLMYMIDWGDGTEEDTDFYPSGEKLTLPHIWQSTGTYRIVVIANDNETDSEASRITVIITERKYV